MEGMEAESGWTDGRREFERWFKGGRLADVWDTVSISVADSPGGSDGEAAEASERAFVGWEE